MIKIWPALYKNYVGMIIIVVIHIVAVIDVYYIYTFLGFLLCLQCPLKEITGTDNSERVKSCAVSGTRANTKLP